MINYAELKFNKKSMISWFLDFFTEGLFTHQCSAENSLGNAAVINNENSTADATYYPKLTTFLYGSLLSYN